MTASLVQNSSRLCKKFFEENFDVAFEIRIGQIDNDKVQALNELNVGGAGAKFLRFAIQ